MLAIRFSLVSLTSVVEPVQLAVASNAPPEVRGPMAVYYDISDPDAELQQEWPLHGAMNHSTSRLSKIDFKSSNGTS